MDSINKRIAEVVAISRCTKTDFAKHINLTQSMVSKLCSGAALPSERTISDICRVYGINEVWLRSGNGEMLDVQSRESMFKEIMAPLASMVESNEEINVIALALAKMPDNVAAEMLTKFTKQLCQIFLDELAQNPSLKEKLSPRFWDICNSYQEQV